MSDELDVYALVTEFQKQISILGTRAAEHAAMSKAREKEIVELKERISELEKVSK